MFDSYEVNIGVVIDSAIWVLFVVHISNFKAVFSQFITVECMISVL